MVCLEIVYDSSLYPEYNEKLENAVGKTSDGAGMGMGEQDMGWYFTSRDRAAETVKRLTKFKHVIIVGVESERKS